MPDHRPSRIGLEAWRELLIIHARVVPRLDDDLRRRTDIDLQTYDTLLHVFEAGETGIRMSTLADKVVITRAGLTSLIDRIQARGLLRRVPDPDDRRATRVVLTAEGEAVFRSAAPIHVEGIDAYFAEHLSDADAETLLRILRPIVGAER